MIREAIISPCKRYRYSLLRHWSDLYPRLLFIMLNPSTADARIDDPTIKRCMRRAGRLGFGSIEVVNLYAWRATYPDELGFAADPVGPDNDSAIAAAIERASKIVAGWGVAWDDLNRADHVKEMVRRSGGELHCLGTTKTGAPRHPLYVSYNTPIIPY